MATEKFFSLDDLDKTIKENGTKFIDAIQNATKGKSEREIVLHMTAFYIVTRLATENLFDKLVVNRRLSDIYERAQSIYKTLVENVKNAKHH